MGVQFIAIGEVLWDLFPDGPRFGGAPANVASHAAALGARACMVSCVGDDDYGRQAREELRQRNINVDFVSTTGQFPTGVVNVRLDDAGKPQFAIQQPAAWDHLSWASELGQLAQHCDAISFGTLGQRSEDSRQVIERVVGAAPARALRVCDVNLRPPFIDERVIRISLELANVLKLSDEEIDIVAAACGCGGSEPEMLAELLDNWGLHLIAVTRGSRGATLLTNDQRSDCEGVSVTVKDTVGAGDAFTASMICGLLRGAPLETINRQACRIASYVCTQSGATPSLPPEFL